MTQAPSAARAALDAILTRDKLHLSPEDYEWLVSLYDETQTQLQLLRGPEFRDAEPASTHVV